MPAPLSYRFLFLTLGFLTGFQTWGQTNNNLLFNNIKVKDGLPANEIFVLNQDSDGFMWFGTNNGILRYDGYSMKRIRQDGSGSIALPDNQITALVNDSSNGIWMGCYAGLIHFDTHTWQSWLIDLGGEREVRCLLAQGDSLLWVGTAQGLIRLDT
ncbi:MAG TPA: two-component regulator propeller domain-containing protein, partial [Prolixibacteraceae bacterium]|nr:two-component regulator propeller domain-containing protein [Prolixibacteraceae bacterium]